MYTENTIAEDWIRSEELFSSKYMYSHLSDFLRYMTLWRFGGIFIDTDTVVMKSFENVSDSRMSNTLEVRLWDFQTKDLDTL
uniref:Alpha-1,4-N-acetylglucosaminyltransferase n=1 Tax=Megaselia scalaris TaxID=36166 RepID=T1GTW0_MEGSC